MQDFFTPAQLRAEKSMNIDSTGKVIDDGKEVPERIRLMDRTLSSLKKSTNMERTIPALVPPSRMCIRDLSFGCG